MKGSRQINPGQFHPFWGKAYALLKWVLIVFGLFSLVFILMGFTHLPFRCYYWLGTSLSGTPANPDYIVVLGGGGMPSRSGLIRCWHAGMASDFFDSALVILALPGDTVTVPGDLSRMFDELVRQGIDPGRILTEPRGANTRAQALNVRKMTAACKPVCEILLVTSPEHMRRSVLSFRKAGFDSVNGWPAFDRALEGNLSFNDDQLGGKGRWVPGIGDNIKIRYRFWDYLQYEIMIMRELSALGYYRLKGWI